jgi:integrase
MSGTPYRANRVLALLSKMFSLAVRWGMRLDNPCKGVERYPEQKRTRYLSADEFKRLSLALEAYPGKAVELAAADHPGNKEAAARARLIAERTTFALGLCILTGCRIGEALGATWAQFDADTGIWTKPASTTKQKAEHRVPLSDAALALLERIRAVAEKDDDGEPKHPHLFPATRGDGQMPYRFALMAWHDIRTTANLKDVRPHDLRHSFASILAARGGSLPLIGALLGHSNPQTTARYAHLFDEAQREGANKVGEFFALATETAR